jgi:hypothetical protein
MSYTLEHFNKTKLSGNSVFTDFFFRCYVLKESGQEHRLTPLFFIKNTI